MDQCWDVLYLPLMSVLLIVGHEDGLLGREFGSAQSLCAGDGGATRPVQLPLQSQQQLWGHGGFPLAVSVREHHMDHHEAHNPASCPSTGTGPSLGPGGDRGAGVGACAHCSG